jgi:hypothetical protein
VKKLLALLALFLTIPINSWATAQLPDKLIYEGKTVGIYSEPLEQYFSKDRPKPIEWMRMTCTALWRGYLATWEIKDDKLYLVKIVRNGCDEDAPALPLSKLFPGAKGPVFATWYTGTLVIPQGKVLKYVHMGYQSIYETELHLRIKDGILVGKQMIDNRRTGK